MTQNFKILFFLKNGKRSNQKSLPIYVRVTINGERVEWTCQRNCDPARWNQQTGRVIGNKDETKSLNEFEGHRRVARALPEGGKLVVMEITLDDDRGGPLLPAVFTVTMIVNTEGGVVRTRTELREMIEGAGFTVERDVTLGERYVTNAIEARKR